MIAVAVGHDDEVELRQVDLLSLRILRENVWVVACVEENALAPVLDQCRISPVLSQGRGLTESVVEYGDLRLGRRRSALRKGYTADEQEPGRPITPHVGLRPLIVGNPGAA